MAAGDPFPLTVKVIRWMYSCSGTLLLCGESSAEEKDIRIMAAALAIVLITPLPPNEVQACPKDRKWLDSIKLLMFSKLIHSEGLGNIP